MAHVTEEKKKVVKRLSELTKQYPIVGLVNMEGLPTPQLQTMRASLRDDVKIIMAKKRLIKIVLESAKTDKPGLEKLEEFLKGMPAMIFTKENPFKLYKTLQKRKSSAPAKGGQIAPTDIVVPAGPTSFQPGPIIGELGSIGVKAGIDAGKVVIKQDSLVVKEGEVISDKVAGLLTRLGIEPMEVGLDLMAAFEEGVIYDRKILSIDESEYIDNIAQAHRWAFNLAIEAGVPTPQTIEVMIVKAHSESRALAISEAILADEVKSEVLARAHAQASGVLSIVQK